MENLDVSRRTLLDVVGILRCTNAVLGASENRVYIEC